MKTAVHFGAGNIGRGFIGCILSQAGYHVVFADVVQELLDRINEEKEYTVHITDVHCKDILIKNISAVNSNSEEIAEKIAGAEIVTTAVGIRILKFVAPAIAKGISARIKSGNDTPLNIIACENGLLASSQLKEMVFQQLSQEEKTWALEHVGFPNCAVDRIVPPVRCENPLDVAVEEHCEWCTEKSAFAGGVPEIPLMHPVDNLSAYLERKLFTLNTGHAITAYLGFMKGKTTIFDAISDPDIFAVVKGAMTQSGAALDKKFGFPQEVQDEYMKLTIRRFKNPYLHDDVTRVGREPLRKLSANDRLILPTTTASSMGLPTDKLMLGAGAALHYNNPDDPQSVELMTNIASEGLRDTVVKVTGLESGSPLVDGIIDAYSLVEKI